MRRVSAAESFSLWINNAMMRLATGGRPVMDGYRLYFMDRFSGHIDHRRDFLASGDDHAVEIAQTWYAGNPMELWREGRKLKRWEAEPIEPLEADR